MILFQNSKPAAFYWVCVLFAIHFRLVPARKEYIQRPDDKYADFGGDTVMTPAPTICPVDDPNDSQDQCNYEDCCAWNNAWCNNSCGNIDPNDTDKVETCDEFMVLIKNACVCNTIGPEFCTIDFRGQILNRLYCATGPDACEGYESPSPTPSPSTLPPSKQPTVVPSLTSSNPTPTPISSTSSPSKETSMSPSAVPIPMCKDSPLKMTFNNSASKKCVWVGKDPLKRCKLRDITSHCPFTCNSPASCNKDSSKNFLLNKELKTCEWVSRRPAKRCKKQSIRKTCRLSCKGINGAYQ